MLEEDYLAYSVERIADSKTKGNAIRYPLNANTDLRLKELNAYSTQLIRELIIPKLTKEINTSKRYASLRQVYYSLIMAQWFKARFRPSSLRAGPAGASEAISGLINSQNLTNLTSKESWSKTTYFKEYQKSFKDGEYNIKEPVYTPYGQSIRSYFSGGISGIAPEIPAFGSSPVTDSKTGAKIAVVPSGSSVVVNGHNIIIRADALEKVYVDDMGIVPSQKESELPGKALDALIDSYDQVCFKKEYQKAYKILREIVAMDPGASHNAEGYFVWLRATLLQKDLNDEKREKIIATLNVFHSNARLLSYLILRRFKQDRTFLNLVIRNKSLDMRIRLYAAGLMMIEHGGGLFFFSETEVQGFIENMGNSEQDRRAISNILTSPLGRYDIQAYIFALIVWIARTNYDLANTLFGNREKLLIILNRIMHARLEREYDNASDLFLIGGSYIQKGSSRELFFVLAHELMHNILTHNFEFESRYALSKQSIHEFIGDLLAGFFASRVGWDLGRYLEIVNAQMQYNRVLEREYRSIEGHEAARAQILIIAKHFNLVEDPYAWEHLFESGIATIIEGQVPRGQVSLIHEDFYEFIRKSLMHYTAKYLRRNIDSSIGSEKPTPKKQIKERYYTFVVPDKVVLEIFGLTTKTNSPSFSYTELPTAEREAKSLGISSPAEGKEPDVSSPLNDEGRGASSPAETKNQAMTPGGIDFRSLPIVTQAISNLSGMLRDSPDLAGQSLLKVNLDEEWQQIERMASSGITPSSERIKEYIQTSCAQDNITQDRDKILLCISDILRLEEERYSPTDPLLRDILVMLESVRGPRELTQVFLGKTVF